MLVLFLYLVVIQFQVFTMDCMRVFRLNKKGCYNLINAQNDQYILEVDDHFVETSKCLKTSSFKLRTKSVDSFLLPRWLNFGKHQLISFIFNLSIFYFLSQIPTLVTFKILTRYLQLLKI